MINSIKIKERLSKKLNNLEILTFDSVTSTNDVAKEYAKNNPAKEVIIISSNQTSGRGTKGRTFFSPDGTGIYMSAILRPAIDISKASLITPYAALCVANAIKDVSDRTVQIKWVNDVYIDGKKTAGILCESSLSVESSTIDYIIVGIGINVFEPECGFPIELKDIATSIFKSSTCDSKIKVIEDLCVSIINQLYEYTTNIDDKFFISEYKKMLCMINKDITVFTPQSSYIAQAIDIDENARLIVKTPEGETKILDSGEISIR